MGKKNKTSFKPGQSGNLNGRPKLPEEVKEARKYTREQFEVLIADFGDKTTEELLQIARNGKSKSREALLASIIAHGIKKGCQARMGYVMDQSIGKVKDNVSVEGSIRVKVEDYTK